jgi:hypothetical protein
MIFFLPLSVLIVISLTNPLLANQGFIVPDEAIPHQGFTAADGEVRSTEPETVAVTSYEDGTSHRTVHRYVDSRRCMRQYPYSSYGPRGIDHYYMPSSPYYDPQYGYNSFRPLHPRPRCRYGRGYNGWDN